MDKAVGAILGIGCVGVLCACSVVGVLFLPGFIKGFSEGFEEGYQNELNKQKQELEKDKTDVDNFQDYDSYDKGSDYDFKDKTGGNSGPTTVDYTNMPGDTVCSPELCRNVWQDLKNAVDNMDPSCSMHTLSNTRRRSTPHDQYEPWSEVWTVSGCGNTSDYLVEYTPDGQGQVIYIVKTM